MKRRIADGAIAGATVVVIRFFGVAWWQALVAGLVLVTVAETLRVLSDQEVDHDEAD